MKTNSFISVLSKLIGQLVGTPHHLIGNLPITASCLASAGLEGVVWHPKKKLCNFSTYLTD
jgi:hypothetical protein